MARVDIPLNIAPFETARMHLLGAIRHATEHGVGEDAVLTRVEAISEWAEAHPDGRGLTMEPSNEVLDLIRDLAAEA